MLQYVVPLQKAVVILRYSKNYKFVVFYCNM
jgi:hypothetical protein